VGNDGLGNILQLRAKSVSRRLLMEGYIGMLVRYSKRQILRRTSGGRRRNGKEKPCGNGNGGAISDSNSVGRRGSEGGRASGLRPILIATLI
jgi:hypothetical protein